MFHKTSNPRLNFVSSMPLCAVHLRRSSLDNKGEKNERENEDEGSVKRAEEVFLTDDKIRADGALVNRTFGGTGEEGSSWGSTLPALKFGETVIVSIVDELLNTRSGRGAELDLGLSRDLASQ